MMIWIYAQILWELKCDCGRDDIVYLFDDTISILLNNLAVTSQKREASRSGA